jgi:hypothetical protein
MKEFTKVQFDPAQCRNELDRLRTLLDSKPALSERDDLLPFFRKSPQLAAFIGTRFPNIGPADRLAYEFAVFGDYRADIVVGNAARLCYCAIELEDARPDSIFSKREGRATSEWGRRMEHGFGQLVDWFFSFDDQKNTAAFAKDFGHGHVEFVGLLLIGRSRDISEHGRRRLRWRSDRVSVNTHRIYCYTYDELYEELDRDWRLLSYPRPDDDREPVETP